MDDTNNLSEEEKRKKQEEISKRLAEIKNKLSSKPGKKPAAKPNPAKEETTAKAPASPPPSAIKKRSGEFTLTGKVQPDYEKPTSSPQKPAESSGLQPEIKISGKIDHSETPAARETPPPTPSKKEQNWSANQLKDEPVKAPPPIKKAPAPQKQEAAPKSPAKKGKKGTTIMFLSLIIIIVALAAGWFMFIYEADNTGLAETEERIVSETKSADEKQITVSTQKTTSSTTNDNEKKVVEKPTVVPPAKVKNDKWGLKRPAFIISYMATGSQQKADGQAKMLNSQGFSAGYYWIPDYLSTGPSLYKVYVGPFTSKIEATKSLSKVKRKKSDAYVQHVK